MYKINMINYLLLLSAGGIIILMSLSNKNWKYRNEMLKCSYDQRGS